MQVESNTSASLLEPLNVTGANESTQQRLSGQMGARALALTVLAFSAPIAVVTGYIPFTITFDGAGACFAFIVTTVLMILFSIGYVTMAKHVPKPGDFYSFISSGLGKIVGLGAAFLAIASYIFILGGTYAFLGISVQAFILSLHGPSTEWWAWAILGWAIVSTLGYFHIELSAKILSLAMVGEVLIVMIFNVAVLVKGGSEGLPIAPLTPAAFFHGDVPVTLLFAILVFLGFEATALFRDEVRDPDRTIPKATYAAVLFIGVLYALSAYTMVAAYGQKAVDVATNTPSMMFPHAIGVFVAPIFTQIAYGFVIASVVAALISIHNVLSRYVLNLALDKAIPIYLGRVHSRHRSPHRASTAVAVCVAVGMMPFIMGNVDANTLYGRMCGLGSLGVIVLMTLVSLAVIVWFIRAGVPAGVSIFRIYIAPAIAMLSLGATVVFALLHFDLVVGGAPGENNALAFVLLATLIAGSLLAVYFKLMRPHVYDSLGRADRLFDLAVDD
ncbi:MULTISPECIES: APC family permease [unclassified Burkholderia]|uniref:APC family permease n=1 Tax=unclassified Burkholderia TaxID=2613784 RepID=UPI002AB19456|nr:MULTISPECIES: APC family permease [unclassified Burkholderia]